MDACAKLTRYHLGSAHTDLKPVFSTYFGKADQLVQEAVARGKQHSGTAAAEDPAEADSGSSCPHPRLSCARSTSQRGGILDIFGVAGACCTHGFPIEGCFVHMYAPEQYSYYDAIFTHVVLAERDVQDMYLDFNCLYERWWNRVTDVEVKQQQEHTRFLIPELHAKGHGISCYRAKSSMYHQGAARRIGEQMEQLWSKCRPYNSTRYMAARNRHDFLDDALYHITCEKVAGFPEQLAALRRSTKAKLGEWGTALGCRHVIAMMHFLLTAAWASCWCCVRCACVGSRAGRLHGATGGGDTLNACRTACLPQQA
jgi:hypothetical protein